MLKANFIIGPKTSAHQIASCSLAECLPRLTLIILAFAIALALIDPLSAQLAQSPNENERVRYHPSPRVRVVSNVIFARYGNRSLRLDLYLPANRKHKVPGAIVIRGGGWMVNDR